MIKKLGALFLLPSLSFGSCMIADVLPVIAPGAQWSMTNNDYNQLNWLDLIQPKPTLAQVNQAITDCQFAATPAQVLVAQRAQAVAELTSGTQPLTKLERAVLLVTLDEINTIRALLPGPPAPRTIPQLKTAVQNKLTSGAAD